MHNEGTFGNKGSLIQEKALSETSVRDIMARQSHPTHTAFFHEVCINWILGNPRCKFNGEG